MDESGLEVAVIGMAGRFPGADNIERFWENLKKGVESITFYKDEELLAAGVKPELLADANYVKCGGGILAGSDCFDAAFFGYSPAEAELMDPQMRIFHECVWHALEDAGYNPTAYDGLIGLFAGASLSLIWEALFLLSGRLEDMGVLAGTLLVDRDYLCTRVSYRLDLKGPAVVVKTACSTSLVAVHMACRAILTGECDLALAGGITVTHLAKSGYIYREGTILSPAGHCKAFDAGAKGTVSGNGVGVVVLKRLDEAVSDRDHIYAVVKGSAINNDGLRKAGYTTPSVEGQAEVIKMALQAAEVEPESIGYVETHGTGTELGDPVEIEGLKLAFNISERGVCPIGSVKANVGHLDSAAGIAGFIKTVLILVHKQIPPSINFETANPKIDFKNSPFYVNTRLSGWKLPAGASVHWSRRAGVSSFGIGGTNAHVVLEECDEAAYKPMSAPLDAERSGHRLVVLSAKTASALEQMSENLARHFEENPGINLADAAYTLQIGRKAFEYKNYFLGTTVAEAIDLLKSPGNQETYTFHSKENSRPIVFMFPGQGAQYVNMALGLYRHEPLFRQEMDRCFEIAKSLGLDIKQTLYPEEPEEKKESTGISGPINQTAVAQPVIFMIEYALAKLLMGWGIAPYAMIGHSIGEYTAACLSGVFSLADALRVTVLRGRLMQGMPPGAMLAVSLSEEELKPLMDRDISLAAVNSATDCVVSGTFEAVEKMTARLKEMGCRCRPLVTSHAFHSAAMDPILAEFEAGVKGVQRDAPVIPFISDVSGGWISTEEAQDPGYWAKHLREPVNFRDGLSRLLAEKSTIFIEVGPGKTLSTFLKKHKEKKADHFAVNLVRHPREEIPDEYYLLNKIGQCWLYGVNIDWWAFYADEKRFRIALPGYPFARQKFPFNTAPLTSGLKIEEWGRSVPPKQAGEALKEPGAAAEKGYALAHTRPDLTRPYAEPRSDTEWALAAIWQDFFGFQPLGIDDDFFELGGDSLNAGTIIARVHRELAVRVPLAEVFNNPTIREMAGYIGKAAKSKYTSIEAVEKREYYVLSSAQQRLFILHRFEEQSTAYNMPYVLSVEAGLDRDKLVAIFSRLIARHESLRTSFEMVDEESVQFVHEDVSFEVEYYETVAGNRSSVVNEKNKGDSHAVEEIIKSFIRPFDLAKAPLLRVGLIRTAGSRSREGDPGERYILMIDMHHIISDGMSHVILVRDFLALYSDREISPLKIQYKEYAQWQQDPQVQQSLARQEAYWLEEFSEEVPILNLATDFPRPQVQSFEGSAIRFELSVEITKRLKAAAVAESATLFMVLLAIYNVFLAKLSSQEDIVVGTAIAGRRYADIEKLVGMFVNTLALRNYPSAESSFAAFLKEVKERTLKAFENDDYHLEDLLDRLVLKRDVSRNPLFDVMFVFQNFLEPSGPGQLAQEDEGELKIASYSFEPGVAKFDLTLTAFETGEKLGFIFEYCSKLFKEETIQRFIGYFKHVTSLLLDNLERKISEIEIVPEEEKRRLLIDFNDTDAEFPQNKTLHELFEERVEKDPQRTALMYEDIQLTYRLLAGRIDRLSRSLRAAGVQADDIVGLMADIGPGTVIGMTAIMKAGGAYLPIDANHPLERKGYLLHDSAAKLLLTCRSFAEEVEKLSRPGLETFFIDDRGFTTAAPDGPGGLAPELKSAHLAYAIYTSGSTGRPKGVLVGHDNIVNQLYGLQKRYAFAAGWHHILLAPLTFDPSVQQIYLPLYSGGKLHLVPDRLKEDPAELFSYIKSRQMDIVNTVPSLMELLLEHTDDYQGIHFKYIILAGEIFPSALHRELRNSLSVDTVINIYGPTEATINTTLYECGQEETNIPIGKPLMNYRVVIFDKNFQLLPIGAGGEIGILGKGVSRGYLNNPELTSERFTYMSYRTNETNISYRLYKTGDLGRWLPDGNIQFLGRIDQQVKIRGIRVELEEIENQFLAHDSIKKAALIAREYKPGSIDLCAYYVVEEKGTDEAHPAVSELRSFLKERLPDYMIPSYFWALDEIPLTAHGKVDAKALPEIGPGNIKLETAYVPPSGELEKRIAAAWKDVLRLEKVGIDDNFFDLGGNSLDIIKVNNRLKGASEKSLSVVSMFKYPTIRSLAAYFSQPAEGEDALTSDRSEALQRGERNRNIRLQMRREMRNN